MRRVLSCLALIFVSVHPAEAGLVVGGFDFSRSGSANIVDGSLTDELRASILANFSGSSITGAGVLTAPFLAGIDVLVIANARSISIPTSPLSVSEQAALLDFINGGGGAFIAADGYFLSEARNFIDPFGMQMSSWFGGLDVGPVINPAGHPVTNGPFGLVSQYTTWFTGWFTDLGPYATPLATLAANGEPSLAVIEAGGLSLNSGRVIITSDAPFGDGGDGLQFPANEVLFLNSIAWLVPAPPSPSPTWTSNLAAIPIQST